MTGPVISKGGVHGPWRSGIALTVAIAIMRVWRISRDPTERRILRGP